MRLGSLDLALGSNVAGSGSTPPPPVPGTAPFYDTFSGGVTPLSSGRTGWTVLATTVAIGNGWQTSFAVSGGNLIRTTSTNLIHAVHDTGAGAGESWGIWKGAANGQASDSLESHITVDATNNNTSMLFGGSSTTINQRYDLNGTHTGAQQFSWDMHPDDVFEHRTVNVGGTMYLQGFHNGRYLIVNAATATSFGIQASLGRAPNGTYGIKGNTNTPAMRLFTAGNAATDAKITIYSSSRVRHPTKPWNLVGTYFSPNGAKPTDANSSVKVIMYNTSDDSIVAGYNGLVVSNLTASGGVWTAQIPNPGIDNVWMEVFWYFKDAGNNTVFTSYPTANIVSGYSIIAEGQSQVGFVDGPTYDTSTAPAYSTIKVALNAPTPGKTVALQAGVNNNYSIMANAIQAYVSKAITFGNFSVGGTTYPQRSLGGSTGMFPCATEALASFFNNVPDIICLSGGTSDIAASPTIYNDMITMANQIEDALGLARGTGVFGVMPEGNNVTYNDHDNDLTRREMWRLTRDDAYGRFKLLGWRSDMQHYKAGVSTTVNQNHYALPGDTGYTVSTASIYGTVGVSEHGRRIALGAALALGLTTDDWRGPKPIAFRRVNSTTLAWKYQMGAFTTVDLVNSAYAGLHTGGHRFCAASDFATLIYPDGHATQTPAGDGTIEIFYTLSTGWPATVYSSGPYGADPFNPGGTTTSAVSLDMLNKASMVVGMRPGMAYVAMQHCYGIGGTNIDYLSA